MTNAPSRSPHLPAAPRLPRSDPKTLATSLVVSVLVHMLAAWWLGTLELPTQPPVVAVLRPRPEIVVPTQFQIVPPGTVPAPVDTVLSRRDPWVQMRVRPLPGTEDMMADFRERWQKPELTQPRPSRVAPPISFDSLAVRTPQEREAVMLRNFAFIVEETRRNLPSLDRMGGYGRNGPNLGMEHLYSPVGGALPMFAVQGLVRGIKELFSRDKGSDEPGAPDLNLNEREIYVLNALWVLGEATPDELYEHMLHTARGGASGVRRTLNELARRNVVRRDSPHRRSFVPNVEREAVLDHFMAELKRMQRDPARAARPSVASRLASVRRRIALLVQEQLEAPDSGG